MERLGTSARSAGTDPQPVGEAEALSSALERIVFLECRLEQQAAAAAAERESARRAREALATASAREAAELGRRSELEAALAAARAENAELVRRLGGAEAGKAAAEAALHGFGEGIARELASARAELEAERRTAEARSRALSDAHARIADLEAAREHLFSRLVAWQRACDGGNREAFDLAEFIAELRREIVALEAARDEGRAREDALRLALGRAGVDPETVLPRVEPTALVPVAPAREPTWAEVPAARPASDADARPAGERPEVEATSGSGDPPPGIGNGKALADRFAVEGRLGISAADVEESFEGMRPAEGRLARRLAGEVAAGPAALRLRAAARLIEVAGRKSAPALAAAAGAETDPELRAALVEHLGRAGDAHALPRIARYLGDEAAAVRAAAVEACVRLAEGAEARGALRRGLSDPEPKVRRRAALAAAAARGVDPGPMLAPLLLDPDRQVRRLAAAALGGTRDAGASLALFSALLDPEPTVRETAADAVSRLFGGDVRVLVALPPLERGRAVARLRAHVTANLARLAPGGQLAPLEVPVASFAEPEPEPSAEPAGIHEPAVVSPAEPACPAVPMAENDRPAAGVSASETDGVAAAVSAAEVVAVAADVPTAEVDAVAAGVSTAEVVAVEAGVSAAEVDAVAAGVSAAEVDGVAADGSAAEVVADAADGSAAEVDGVAAEVAAAEVDRTAEEPEAEGGISLAAIVSVLRASLRGATPAALAAELGCDEAVLAPVVESHLAAGNLVRRGKKLFLP